MKFIEYESIKSLWNRLEPVREDFRPEPLEQLLLTDFESRFGPAGELWEVLQISSVWQVVHINVSTPILNPSLILELRDFVVNHDNHFGLLVHVFEERIPGPGEAAGLMCIYQHEIWTTPALLRFLPVD